MGIRIKAMRKARGMTQQQLADACGVHRITIARIEHGEYSPHIDNVAKLAAALSCTIDELVKESEETQHDAAASNA